MQILVNGFASGLGIAMLAIAFTSVYLPTKVFHVGLGAVYSLVPYVGWASLQAGCSWPLAIIFSIISGVVLSVLCEILNHGPLENQKASAGAHLISSLGIYIVVVQSIAMIWGNQSKVLFTDIGSTITLGDIFITWSQLLIICIGLFSISAYLLWIKFSKLGLKFRALANNPNQFALLGFNIRYLRLSAFMVSGVMCSIASLLTATDIGFDSQSGLSIVLLAVTAMIVGGQQVYLGAVLGGVMMGLIRAQVVWFFSAKWQDAVTFIVLALVLVLRPYGLLGRKERLEAGS